MNIEIRKAIPEEAEQIIDINIKVWNSAYKNLIPQEIIDKLQFKNDERIKSKEKSLRDKNNTFVALVDGKMVGFHTFGKTKFDGYPNAGEIYAGYILDEKNFYRHEEIGVGENEFVSSVEVKVIEEITIPNVWKYFKKLENEGKFKIYRYPDRPKKYPKDDSDLIECAMLMYKQMGDFDKAFSLLLKYHPELEDKVNEIKELIAI